MKNTHDVNVCQAPAGGQARSRTDFYFLLCFAVMTALLLPARTGYAAPITRETVITVAQNFIAHQGWHAALADLEPLEHADQVVGYLFHLSPRGYILVSRDTIRVPVKACSLSLNFGDLPPAYRQFLVNELALHREPESPMKSAHRFSTTGSEVTNQPYWDFLTQPVHPAAV